MGAKVQLKNTATDHDHGFKIDTLPDGSAPSDTPGLIFGFSARLLATQKGRNNDN
jgi:hypothetical protein